MNLHVMRFTASGAYSLKFITRPHKIRRRYPRFWTDTADYIQKFYDINALKFV